MNAAAPAALARRALGADGLPPELHEYGEVVFATRHGSALYGFQTESSDEDWFVVTTSKRRGARQSVTNGFDVTRIGWDSFLEYALSGSHQSLEAAFSSQKVWIRPEQRAFLEGMRVSSPDVFRKYSRTVKKFCFGDFKRRRHAVRLAGDLVDLRRHGRFEPERTHREAAFAGTLAENLAGHVLAGVLLAQF